jgi:hypothetical protein
MVFCLVFFGLPILMVSWEVGTALEVRETQIRAQLEIALEKSFGPLTAHIDTVRFFQENMAHLFARFSREKDSRVVRQALEAFRRRFPRNIDYVVVAPSGRIATRGSTLPFAPTAFRELSTAFTTCGVDRQYLLQHWAAIQSPLGSGLKSSDVQPGLFKPASENDFKRLIFLSDRHPFGFGIVFLHQTADWDGIVLRERIRAGNQGSTDRLLGLFDEETGRLSDRRFAAAVGGPTSPVLRQLATTPQGFAHTDQGSFAQIQFTPSIRLLAYQPRRSSGVTELRTVFVLVMALLFSLAAGGARLVQTGRVHLFLSLRTKLLALFFFSAGLPLIVTIFLAWDYAQERRSLLEEQTLRQLENIVRQIDLRFPRIRGIIQQRIMQSGSESDKSGTILEAHTIARLHELQKSIHADNIWIADQEGNRVAEKQFRTNDGINLSFKYAKIFYINLFRNLNHEAQKEGGLGDDAVQSFASAGGIDFQEFFSGLSQALGKFHEVRLGFNHFFHFLAPVRDEKGVTRLLTLFNWERRALEKLYLRLCVPQILRVPEPVFLAANREGDPEDHLTPHFREIFREGWRRAIPENPVIRYQVRRGDATLLVSVIRGQELPHCKLGAMMSDRHIRREIRGIWWRLFGLCGLILLAGYAFGVGLGRLFLQPVAHLETGLAALQRRDFQTQLPVDSYDELGKLLSAFNRLAEGMADLELARTLQENLFPTEPFRRGPLSLHGSCQAAARIGGDYFDYRELTGGRLLFLIGDVSGHGSGAAMVVSIVKGIIALAPADFDPAHLLGRVNQVLLTVLRRKKMMTAVLGYIDLTTHAMVFANAGHIGPMVVRDGQTLFLEGQSWVLGIRKAATYANETFALQAGDTAVLLTDGLPEARDKNGNQLGYDIVCNELPRQIRDTPEATDQQIRAWHSDLIHPNIPQEDDITLLILQMAPKE